MRFAISALLAAGAVVTMLVSTDVSAVARSPYDGDWSVLITTSAGNCPPSYRSSVRIINGIVRGTDPAARVAGSVSRGGAVRVSVSSGQQHAFGTGRLSGRSGAGRWSSPAGCAGIWQAQRM